MYDNAVREQFVELRAQGKTFAFIAENLHVSKPTLIEWSRENNEQIQNFKAIHDEALREKYRITRARQLQLLSSQLEAVEKELGDRHLSELSTEKLYGILFKLVGELRGLDIPLSFQHTQSTLMLETFLPKMEWIG